jgi:hypothetical protein
MKYKTFAISIIALLTVTLLCAFKIDPNSSLKDLTHPYINRYECTQARLGENDLLENYEYFRIDILDEKNLEISFKRKEGKPHSYKSTYTFNAESGELTAEIGILGCKFKQAVIIENGAFTISMPILYRQLIMNFSVK